MRASRIVESNAPRATVLIRCAGGTGVSLRGHSEVLVWGGIWGRALRQDRYAGAAIFCAPCRGHRNRVRRDADRRSAMPARRYTAADRHQRRYSYDENSHAREVRILGRDARGQHGFLHVAGSVVPIDRRGWAAFGGCASVSQEDGVRRPQLSRQPAIDLPVPLTELALVFL